MSPLHRHPLATLVRRLATQVSAISATVRATRRLDAGRGALIGLAVALVAGCGQGESTRAAPQGATPPGGAAKAAAPAAGAPAKPAGGAPGGMPPPEVAVVVVQPATVTRTEELPGRLQAAKTAQVRARVEGIVEERLFREGTDVKAGDVLYRLDDRTLRAAVASAEAALAKSRADAAVAAATEGRYRAVLDDRGISPQEYDQAFARKRQTEADVAAAQAALERARIDLGHATVRAPIAGRIGRTLVTEGALVGRGEATHLTTIEQVEPIWANFSQSSVEFLRLRQQVAGGRAKSASDVPVTLLLEDGTPYARSGRLLFQDLAVDPATGTVALRAEFPNPQRELLPGQFVRVRLPLARASDAIVVPQRAVQASPQGQIVMTVGADGTVAPRPVRTGGLSGTDWIVTEGLAPGDQVIVEGLQKIRPGMPVRPVAAGATPAGGAPAGAPAGGGTPAPSPAKAG